MSYSIIYRPPDESYWLITAPALKLKDSSFSKGPSFLAKVIENYSKISPTGIQGSMCNTCIYCYCCTECLLASHLCRDSLELYLEEAQADVLTEEEGQLGRAQPVYFSRHWRIYPTIWDLFCRGSSAKRKSCQE